MVWHFNSIRLWISGRLEGIQPSSNLTSKLMASESGGAVHRCNVPGKLCN